MPSFLLKNYRQKPKRADDSPWIVRWGKRVLMTFGALFFLSMIGNLLFITIFFSGGKNTQPLPNEFIVSMEMEQSMPDIALAQGWLAEFFPPDTSLLDFLRAMKAAKDDDRVRGFAVRLYDGDYSLTQLQTIREAIQDFKTSGKKTILYTDNFGGFSNGIGEYWLASVFDEIWVQPIGLVSLNGIRLEQPYLEDALDKIGVDMELENRKAFKTGGEMYTRNTMSRENRITLNAIVDDFMGVMMNDIAEGRGLKKSQVKRLIDRSPLLPEEALKAGLIDKIGYFDEFKLAFNPVEKDLPLETKTEEKTEEGDIANEDVANEKVEATSWPVMENHFDYVSLDRYKDDAKDRLGIFKNNAHVAVVHIKGMILESEERAKVEAGPKAFLVPDDIADAEEISDAIKKASKMSRVKVIILRVNSPGGSPGASETIRRAVIKAQERGKYVIVSMSDLAASGGYWVSANGDEIIASPLTITGSIGVYGGKPNLRNLWRKLGVQWGVVEYGQNAGMWSMTRGYSTTERRRLDAMMDHIYDEFIDLVADGRGMGTKDVEKVAKGRAWTGLDALDAGLADHLGGFDLALKRAAEKAEIDRWETMPIINLPQEDDPFEDFARALGLPVSITSPEAIIPDELKQFYLPSSAVVTSPAMLVDF